MKRSTLAKILKKAEILSKAIEAETEEILEDAEKAIKASVPASSTSESLAKVEKLLENEGIEALFEKKVPKIAMKRTAGEKLSKEEIEELAKKIAKAVVDEMEDVLKDADDVMDEEVATTPDEMAEVEGKLKSVLERKLAEKGIYSKFARNSKPAKVASKVESTPKKNVSTSAVEKMATLRKKRK